MAGAQPAPASIEGGQLYSNNYLVTCCNPIPINPIGPIYPIWPCIGCWPSTIQSNQNPVAFEVFAYYSPNYPNELQIRAVSYDTISQANVQVVLNNNQYVQAMAPYPENGAFIPSALLPGFVTVQMTLNTTTTLSSVAGMPGINQGVTIFLETATSASVFISLNQIFNVLNLPAVTNAYSLMLFLWNQVYFPTWEYYTCVPFNPAVQNINSITVTGTDSAGILGTSDGSFTYMQYDSTGALVNPSQQSAMAKLIGGTQLDFLNPLSTGNVPVWSGVPTNTPIPYCPPSPTPTITMTPTVTVTPTHTPSATPTTSVPSNIFVSQNMFQPSQEPAGLGLAVHVNESGHYLLCIYNSAGEMVKTLRNKQVSGPWNETVTWDGTNEQGSRVASGVYIIRLTTTLTVHTARLAVIH
jgi:hypothetical protein